MADLLDQIRQIDATLRRFAPKRRPLINLTRPEKSGAKVGILMSGLRSSSVNADVRIAERLEVSATDQSFHSLKSTIFARLANGLFLIDLKSQGYSDYAVAYNRNLKLVFIARILAFLGVREVANEVAKKGLGTARKYEFSSNALEFISILHHGALLARDRQKMRKLSDESKRWVEAYAAELAIAFEHDEIVLLQAAKGSANRKVILKAADAAIEADRLRRKIGTFAITLVAFRLRALSFQCQEDYESCLVLCRAAENYIHSRAEFANPTRIAEFAVKRLICCIHLRNATEAIDAFHICEAAYPAGTVNWFVMMEYKFLSLSSSLKLAEARECYDLVVHHQSFFSLPEHRREKWLIFNLYLLYAEGKLRLTTRLNSKQTKTFRDFISWVPSYAQDKAGYNAAVLLLHVLYLIDRKDWSQMLDRIAALEAYRARHLKGKNRQADAFIELLLTLEKGDYNRRKVEALARPLLEKLSGLRNSNDALLGVQILPFEDLWSRIINSL